MLPNFFVIGAAKSGTTSLHWYLGLHPEIHMSRVKEPNFFVPEDAPALLGAGRKDARQDEVPWARRSRLDYEALFEPARIRGESSVHYSMYPAIRGVPERITGLIPDARFIYIVRDPIERIRSHYLQLAKSTAQPSLDDALGDLDDPGNRLMCPSRYMTQVNRYLAVAPSERILVVDFARLRDQRRSELARIFSFLSVDPAYWCDGFTEKHHVTASHRDRSRRVGCCRTRPSARWRIVCPIASFLQRCACAWSERSPSRSAVGRSRTPRTSRPSSVLSSRVDWSRKSSDCRSSPARPS